MAKKETEKAKSREECKKEKLRLVIVDWSFENGIIEGKVLDLVLEAEDGARPLFESRFKYFHRFINCEIKDPGSFCSGILGMSRGKTLGVEHQENALNSLKHFY